MYRIAEKKRIKLEKKKFQRKRLGRIKCVSVMDRLATQRHASPCNHEATLQRNIRVERVKNRRREQAAGWNEFSLQRSLVCDARRRNPVLARRYLATCQKSGREIDDPRLSSKPTSTSNSRFYEKRRILASGELLGEKEKKKKKTKKGERKRKTSKHANGVIPSPDDLVTI